MPEQPPDSAEAGTLNVPGIAGLYAGLCHLKRTGMEHILKREQQQVKICAAGLRKLGMKVFEGPHQAGTISFLPGLDCEVAAQILARRGIAVRAGLHCAPLAHESAGTLETGTVRVSFGYNAENNQSQRLLSVVSKLMLRKS
jgi:selenocysteine lyase/cysteine desulfurase